MRLLAVAIVALLLPAPARADPLTLACLDLGRMVEACRAAAKRFETATGNTVRVVAADATGRISLERYRALFDVASPRLDVVQLADGWVPALAGDLATLPSPADPLAVPDVVAIGRDARRLVALPQAIALTLLVAPSDAAPDARPSWSELRANLAQAPAEGVAAVSAGAAAPTLFPLFLDMAFAFGAGALDDRTRLLAALTALDGASGPLAPAAAADGLRFASTEATALAAASTAERVAPAAAGQGDAAEAPARATTAQGGAPAAGSAGGPAAAAPVLVSSWFVAVSRHSRSFPAATALARHLTSADEERRAALDFAIAPARPALYDEADVVAVGPAFARIAAALPRLAPPPVVRYGPGYLDLADEVAAALRRMLRGESEPDETAIAILRAARRADQMVAD